MSCGRNRFEENYMCLLKIHGVQNNHETVRISYIRNVLCDNYSLAQKNVGLLAK